MLNAAAFTNRGVIIRPMSGGWVRVTIGTEAENQRFVAVLDEVVPNLLEPAERQTRGAGSA